MNRINLEQGIIDFSEDLKIPASNYGTLLKWAIKCEKRISSPYSHLIEAKTYTITNNYISLPSDVRSVFKVFFGDVTDQFEKLINDRQEVKTQTSELGDLEYEWIELSGGIELNELLWEWVNGDINLTGDYDGEEVTVFQSSLEKDDEGRIIVNESHIEPIRLFLELKFAERGLFHKSMSNSVDGGTVNYLQDLRARYHTEVRNARALDTAESNIDQDRR